jgi:hypothetical protein
VHSALVSFLQVYDDRFQAESGLNILTLLIEVSQILGTTIQNLNLSAGLAHAFSARLCYSIVARADVNHNYF